MHAGSDGLLPGVPSGVKVARPRMHVRQRMESVLGICLGGHLAELESVALICEQVDQLINGALLASLVCTLVQWNGVKIEHALLGLGGNSSQVARASRMFKAGLPHHAGR